MHDSIFREYDIRGIYQKDFDDQFAFKLGNKIGHHLSSGSGDVVIVGKDGRPSSNIIGERIIEGLLSSSVRVVSLGECSTPLWYFVVRKFGSAGGIMVTASHNEGEYNGFKVVGPEADIISGQELKYIWDRTEVQTHEYRPEMYEERDFTDEYAEAIIGTSKFKKEKDYNIKYSAPPGVARILTTLAVITGLNFNETSGDISIQFDGDGDRIIFDADGPVFNIIVDEIQPRKVVCSVSTSLSIRRYLNEKGIKTHISKVGRSHVFRAMKEYDADLGVEASGHIYFKSFRYLEAPELALLLVLNQMQKSVLSLDKQLEKYPKYYQKIIEIDSNTVTDMLLDRIEEKYIKGDINFIDGLTVEFPHWWFNIRHSNTENIFRLTIESDTKDLLDEKVSEIKNLLG